MHWLCACIDMHGDKWSKTMAEKIYTDTISIEYGSEMRKNCGREIYAGLLACIDSWPDSKAPNERNKSNLTSSKVRKEIKDNSLERWEENDGSLMVLYVPKWCSFDFGAIDGLILFSRI